MRDYLLESAEAFLQASKLKQNDPSWIDYQGTVLGDFLAFTRGHGHARRMDELLPFHMTLFLAAQQDKGNRPATLNRKGTILRAWARWAVREGLVKACPMVAGIVPAEPKEDLEIPPLEVLEALADEAHAPALRDLFLVSLDSGLRRGELLNLRWSEVDFDSSTIRVRNTREWKPKSRKGRTVGISLRAAQILARRQLLGGAGPWMDENGIPLWHPNSVSQAWRRICHRAGIRTRLHDLRHAHATDLLDSGATIREVQAQLGHANVSTTERYTHVSRAVARRLAQLQQRGAAPSAGRIDFS